MPKICGSSPKRRGKEEVPTCAFAAVLAVSATHPYQCEKLGNGALGVAWPASTQTELKARRDELREKKISRDTRPSPRGIYETFENTSPWLPAGKDSARDLIAHIGAELRRMVERIEVEKDQPIKVIPRS